jgi:hypothetical protein
LNNRLHPDRYFLGSLATPPPQQKDGGVETSDIPRWGNRACHSWPRLEGTPKRRQRVSRCPIPIHHRPTPPVLAFFLWRSHYLLALSALVSPFITIAQSNVLACERVTAGWAERPEASASPIASLHSTDFTPARRPRVADHANPPFAIRRRISHAPFTWALIRYRRLHPHL